MQGKDAAKDIFLKLLLNRQNKDEAVLLINK
jgi:hypothetical protein